MINGNLIRDYQLEVGPIDFTLTWIKRDPALEEQVAEMMRAAIRGERGPITDAELGLEVPGDAVI